MDDAPGQGDASPPAGELVRVAVPQVRHADPGEGVVDEAPPLLLDRLAELEPQGEAVGGGHARPERVRLEDLY